MIHTDKQKTVRLDVGCNAFHVNITQKCYDESCVRCTLLFFWCYRDKKKIKKNKNNTRHRIKEDCLSGDFFLFYCDFYCCCCWCLWFRGHDNIQYSVCPQLRMLNIVDIYVLSNDGTVNVYCCVFTGIGQCTLNQSHCYIETHIYLIRIGFNADGHDEDYINVSELNHKILCVGRFICCYCSCVRSQT